MSEAYPCKTTPLPGSWRGVIRSETVQTVRDGASWVASEYLAQPGLLQDDVRQWSIVDIDWHRKGASDSTGVSCASVMACRANAGVIPSSFRLGGFPGSNMISPRSMRSRRFLAALSASAETASNGSPSLTILLAPSRNTLFASTIPSV